MDLVRAFECFYRYSTEDDPSLSTTLFSFLLLARGIGNILTTPISTALQGPIKIGDSTATYETAQTGFGVDGGHYRTMIIYAGSCFAAAAFVTLTGWAVEKRRRSRDTLDLR